MPHLITIKKPDGTETAMIECLTIPDLTTHLVRALQEIPGSEVRVKEISVSEARDVAAMREIIERCQSPESLDKMRRMFDVIANRR